MSVHSTVNRGFACKIHTSMSIQLLRLCLAYYCLFFIPQFICHFWEALPCAFVAPSPCHLHSIVITCLPSYVFSSDCRLCEEFFIFVYFFIFVFPRASWYRHWITVFSINEWIQKTCFMSWLPVISYNYFQYISSSVKWDRFSIYCK